MDSQLKAEQKEVQGEEQSGADFPGSGDCKNQEEPGTEAYKKQKEVWEDSEDGITSGSSKEHPIDINIPMEPDIVSAGSSKDSSHIAPPSPKMDSQLSTFEPKKAEYKKVKGEEQSGPDFPGLGDFKSQEEPGTEASKKQKEVWEDSEDGITSGSSKEHPIDINIPMEPDIVSAGSSEDNSHIAPPSPKMDFQSKSFEPKKDVHKEVMEEERSGPNYPELGDCKSQERNLPTELPEVEKKDSEAYENPDLITTIEQQKEIFESSEKDETISDIKIPVELDLVTPNTSKDDPEVATLSPKMNSQLSTYEPKKGEYKEVQGEEQSGPDFPGSGDFKNQEELGTEASKKQKEVWEDSEDGITSGSSKEHSIDINIPMEPDIVSAGSSKDSSHIAPPSPKMDSQLSTSDIKIPVEQDLVTDNTSKDDPEVVTPSPSMANELISFELKNCKPEIISIFKQGEEIWESYEDTETKSDSIKRNLEDINIQGDPELVTPSPSKNDPERPEILIPTKKSLSNKPIARYWSYEQAIEKKYPCNHNVTRTSIEGTFNHPRTGNCFPTNTTYQKPLYGHAHYEETPLSREIDRLAQEPKIFYTVNGRPVRHVPANDPQRVAERVERAIALEKYRRGVQKYYRELRKLAATWQWPVEKPYQTVAPLIRPPQNKEKEKRRPGPSKGYFMNCLYENQVRVPVKKPMAKLLPQLKTSYQTGMELQTETNYEVQVEMKPRTSQHAEIETRQRTSHQVSMEPPAHIDELSKTSSQATSLIEIQPSITSQAHIDKLCDECSLDTSLIETQQSPTSQAHIDELCDECSQHTSLIETQPSPTSQAHIDELSKTSSQATSLIEIQPSITSQAHIDELCDECSQDTSLIETQPSPTSQAHIDELCDECSQHTSLVETQPSPTSQAHIDELCDECSQHTSLIETQPSPTSQAHIDELCDECSQDTSLIETQPSPTSLAHIDELCDECSQDTSLIETQPSPTSQAHIDELFNECSQTMSLIEPQPSPTSQAHIDELCDECSQHTSLIETQPSPTSQAHIDELCDECSQVTSLIETQPSPTSLAHIDELCDECSQDTSLIETQPSPTSQEHIDELCDECSQDTSLIETQPSPTSQAHIDVLFNECSQTMSLIEPQPSPTSQAHIDELCDECSQHTSLIETQPSPTSQAHIDELCDECSQVTSLIETQPSPTFLAHIDELCDECSQVTSLIETQPSPTSQAHIDELCDECSQHTSLIELQSGTSSQANLEDDSDIWSQARSLIDLQSGTSSQANMEDDSDIWSQARSRIDLQSGTSSQANLEDHSNQWSQARSLMDLQSSTAFQPDMLEQSNKCSQTKSLVQLQPGTAFQEDLHNQYNKCSQTMSLIDLQPGTTFQAPIKKLSKTCIQVVSLVEPRPGTSTSINLDLQLNEKTQSPSKKNYKVPFFKVSSHKSESAITPKLAQSVPKWEEFCPKRGWIPIKIVSSSDFNQESPVLRTLTETNMASTGMGMQLNRRRYSFPSFVPLPIRKVKTMWENYSSWDNIATWELRRRPSSSNESAGPSDYLFRDDQDYENILKAPFLLVSDEEYERSCTFCKRKMYGVVVPEEDYEEVSCFTDPVTGELLQDIPKVHGSIVCLDRKTRRLRCVGCKRFLDDDEVEYMKSWTLEKWGIFWAKEREEKEKKEKIKKAQEEEKRKKLEKEMKERAEEEIKAKEEKAKLLEEQKKTCLVS